MVIKSEEAKEKKRIARRKYNARPANIKKRSENVRLRRKSNANSNQVVDHKEGYGKKNPKTKIQSAKASQRQGGKKISRNKAHMAKIGRRGGKAKG